MDHIHTRAGTLDGVQADYVLRIVLAGDSGVGKTSILERFRGRGFRPEPDSTIGVDFHTTKVRLEGEGEGVVFKLQIWDTAGHERFHTITRAYFRNTAACVLVYDATDAATAASLAAWSERVLEASPQTLRVVVASKVDAGLGGASEVAAAWCDAEGRLPHYGVSAKDNGPRTSAAALACVSIGTLFEEVARRIYEARIRGASSTPMADFGPGVRVAGAPGAYAALHAGVGGSSSSSSSSSSCATCGGGG
jgi:small GTP-binding protein